MDQVNSTTQHQKGKHLSFEERVIIQRQNSSLVYYAHPYSSWEKGSNERHKPSGKAFYSQGRAISDYGIDANWCNNLPRKILGYKTPDELFEAKLDEIYSA